MEDSAKQEVNPVFPKKEAAKLLDLPFLVVTKEPMDGITGFIYLAFYFRTDTLPKGLGRWVHQLQDLQESFSPTPQTWLAEPTDGTLVALKIARTGQEEVRHFRELGIERTALYQTNNLFQEEEEARPARLFGYGVSEKESPYLILEGLDTPFANLEAYLKQGGRLFEKEALEIALRVCSILSRVHDQGIIYGDINGYKMDNIFWDPTSKRVRLIDWANAIDTVREEKYWGGRMRGATSFGHDQQGLAEILYKLVTGQDCPDRATIYSNPQAKENFKRGLQNMSNATQTVIRKALNIDRGREERYNPFTKESTGQMLVDLRTAHQALA